MWRYKQKAENLGKNGYRIHINQEKPKELASKHPDNAIIFTSIDPAQKNFCVRIEKRTKINNKIKVETLFMQKIDLTTDEKNLEGTEFTLIYHKLNKVLEQLNYYFIISNYIIIEQQLPVEKNLRIFQHTLCYIMLQTRLSPYIPEIVELCPKMKSKVLGCPKGADVKDFCKIKAKELTEERNDDISRKRFLEYKNKQDDISDVICQIEAYIILRDIKI